MTKKNKILIVEDDRTSANLLQDILVKAKYTVSGIVESGEDAIKAVKKDKPDLVLMDITLEGELDGIETSKILNQEFGIHSIYITSSTDKQTITRAKETAPFGYILKPYNKEMIRASIEMALFRIEAERKIREIAQRNRGIVYGIPDLAFYLKRDGSFVSQLEEKEAEGTWPRRVSRSALPVIEKSLLRGRLLSLITR